MLKTVVESGCHKVLEFEGIFNLSGIGSFIRKAKTYVYS